MAFILIHLLTAMIHELVRESPGPNKFETQKLRAMLGSHKMGLSHSDFPRALFLLWIYFMLYCRIVCYFVTYMCVFIYVSNFG